MPFDVAEVRSRFPALGRAHRGRPVAYFDGPGGTQVPRAVIDAMTDYLAHHNANTNWRYPSSIETDEMIARSRRAVADLINASEAAVAFGQNMTTLTFHLARGLAREWKRGDTIVVTDLDHHANIAPWTEVARDGGFRIRRVSMDTSTGELRQDELEHALADGPVLLAIGAASNALGTINDVTAACRLARDAGALTFVDAVHYAPHELIDVQAFGCDWLACSPYKFYGPHLGVLYGRRDRIDQLDVPKLAPAPDHAPERLETGTLSHEAIAGAAAAVDFLASLGGEDGSRRHRLARAYREIHAHEHRLFARLWTGVRSIAGICVYGPAPDRPRTPTMSIEIRGRSPDDVASALADEALFASSGDFYAATIMERLHRPDGLVRLGVSCYTDDTEIDRVLEALAALA